MRIWAVLFGAKKKPVIVKPFEKTMVLPSPSLSSQSSEKSSSDDSIASYYETRSSKIFSLSESEREELDVLLSYLKVYNENSIEQLKDRAGLELSAKIQAIELGKLTRYTEYSHALTSFCRRYPALQPVWLNKINELNLNLPEEPENFDDLPEKQLLQEVMGEKPFAIDVEPFYFLRSQLIYAYYLAHYEELKVTEQGQEALAECCKKVYGQSGFAALRLAHLNSLNWLNKESPISEYFIEYILKRAHEFLKYNPLLGALILSATFKEIGYAYYKQARGIRESRSNVKLFSGEDLKDYLDFKSNSRLFFYHSLKFFYTAWNLMEQGYCFENLYSIFIPSVFYELKQCDVLSRESIGRILISSWNIEPRMCSAIEQFALQETENLKKVVSCP